MFIRKIIITFTPQPKFCIPLAIAHTNKYTNSPSGNKPRKVCRSVRGSVKKTGSTSLNINRGPVCPPLKVIKGGAGGTDEEGTGLKRAKSPGKCRLGFIPEEWFLFLRPITGVTGPYILMLGLANYLISKEIFAMEHEYYLGLSISAVLYLITTRLGPKIGIALDQKVDAYVNELKQARADELASYKKQIKDAETGIWRAQGQKILIDVKKENIALQLEAIYRERLMLVQKTVKSRMGYHIRKMKIEKRIKQKWMVQWILENVDKAITPEFKKRTMEIAIKDLEALANRIKQK